MSEAIRRAVVRSRSIREIVLRQLNSIYAYPNLGLTYETILVGFSTGVVRYTVDEIEGELVSLIQDGLIVQFNAPGGEPLPEKLYRIIKNGHDFVLANFPWMRVDEYTGKQELQ